MTLDDLDECECGHDRDEHKDGQGECSHDMSSGLPCSCPSFVEQR